MADGTVTWTQVGGAAQEAGNMAWGTTRTLPEIIGMIISVALSLLGIVFLVLAVYSGYRWMTARGDQKDVTEAKESLKNAIIGLVIIVASYALSSFILKNIIAAAQ